VIQEIVARGATLREVFIDAALALFALAANPGKVAEREVREIRAHGSSLQALLAHWIGECCYVGEIEGFECRAIEFAVFEVEARPGGEPMRLHALLRGDVDPEGSGNLALGEPGAFRLHKTDTGYEAGFSIDV
jgi:SHS2 domain-containing protein